jgi:aldehyde dehydrogenase (NAD+)
MSTSIDTQATPIDSIAGVVDAVRTAFVSGRTKPLAWRRATLLRLRAEITAREAELLAALHADVGKPRFEAWVTEVGFCLADIDHTLAHLASWAAKERVATPPMSQPSSSHIVREPLGVACVIAPWNYPAQLLLAPVIAAIAAGNAVVAKPSEVTPSVDRVLGAMFASIGEPALQIVHGGVAETTELLRQRFDHILYTGNGRVGRIVMKAAAEHLTPVTLELGGKSPAIVSRHANIAVSAKRIVWGKFLNAGQTCIAPDYVLVESDVHDELVAAMTAVVNEFYGSDPSTSADYARIVSDAHFARLERFLHQGTVACGGRSDAGSRYIEPTILTGITRSDPIMDEEIFGPVLPVLKVDSLEAAVGLVNEGDKPLALYVFSERSAESDTVIANTSSGGACVNATIMHVANPNLPFGGVGPSGMGAYHGKAGFDTFSHRRSVHTRPTRLDPPVIYPPYTAGKEKLMRRGIGDPRDVLAKLVGTLRHRDR